MEKTINVGLAAYGMSGEVFHAPLLATHPGFKLTTVLERRSQRSSQKYPDVTIVRSFDELVSSPALDLIIINTPNRLHFEQAKKALQAGKHVIIEKPFTVSSAEAKELISLAKAENKIISVFQNRRWDGDFLTVQQVVQQQLLGSLVEFEGHYDRYRNYIEANTWKEETGPGSGILYNLGSHMIDQALVLFGLPHSVTADIRIQRPGGKIDDSYDLLLDYKHLRVILKSSYLVREAGPRYTLHGTDGSFIKYGLDPQEDDLKAGKLPGSKDWGMENPQYYGKINTQLNGLHLTGTIETLPGAYQQFYENIYGAISQGKPLSVKPDEAMQVIRIIEAAIESNTEKKTVYL